VQRPSKEEKGMTLKESDVVNQFPAYYEWHPLKREDFAHVGAGRFVNEFGVIVLKI